jgi:methionine-rich copper-binding protein CopC
MTRVFAFVAAACLIGQAAFAHAFLDRASPAVGSEINASPPSLRLTYTEPIEPAFSSVLVTNGAGSRVDQGPAETERGGRVLIVRLKPLPPGVYHVEWHVTSVDTHKTEGHFSFTVKP